MTMVCSNEIEQKIYDKYNEIKDLLREDNLNQWYSKQHLGLLCELKKNCEEAKNKPGEYKPSKLKNGFLPMYLDTTLRTLERQIKDIENVLAAPQ